MMAKLTDTVWHEARHAEQWHLMVRHLDAQGLTPDQIGKKLYMDKHAVQASLADKVPLSDQQKSDGKKYFDAVYNQDASTGGQRAHRDDVLSRLGSDPAAYEQYRQLREELDAWAVGTAAGNLYRAKQDGPIEPHRIIDVNATSSEVVSGPIEPQRIITIAPDTKVIVTKDRTVIVDDRGTTVLDHKQAPTGTRAPDPAGAPAPAPGSPAKAPHDDAPSTKKQLDSLDSRHRERAEALLAGTKGLDPKLAAEVERVAIRESSDPDRANALKKLIDNAGHDPAGATALADAIARLDVARKQEIRVADPVAHDAAKQKLAAKEPLAPHETRALLDLAVGIARQGMIAEMQGVLTPKQALAAENLGGMCGPAQGRVANVLEAILVEHGGSVIRHASHDDPDVARPGSKLVSGDTAHYFTVVKMPDGQAFLIDPTFGQFLQAHPEAGKTGTRLLANAGGDVAGALVQSGYIPLTPEVARAYGQAITGRSEDFSVGDFLDGNAVADKRGQMKREDQRLAESGASDAAAKAHAGLAGAEPANAPSADPHDVRKAALDHEVAVDAEMRRILAADPSLTPEQARGQARLKVVHDEIARGLPDQQQEQFADDRRRIESERRKGDKPEDLSRSHAEHERAVAEEALRLLADDATREKGPKDEPLTVEQALEQARKKVVQDEIELGMSPDEKSASALRKRAEDVAAVAIKLLGEYSKPGAAILEVIVDAIKTGKVDHTKLGDAAIDTVVSVIGLVAEVLIKMYVPNGGDLAKWVADGLKEVQRRLKERHPAAREEAGGFLHALRVLTNSPEDLHTVRGLVLEHMPEGASHTETLERWQAIIESAKQKRKNDPSLTRDEAFAQARDDVADNAGFENARKAAAKADADGKGSSGDLDLSGTSVADDDGTRVLAPEQLARKEAAERELLAARRAVADAERDAVIAETDLERDVADANLSAARQDLAAIERARAVEALHGKQIDAQESRVAAARLGVDLADIPVNDAIAHGKKPRPEDIAARDLAERRLAHQLDELERVRNTPPAISPARVRVGVDENAPGPIDDAPRTRIDDAVAKQAEAELQALEDDAVAEHVPARRKMRLDEPPPSAPSFEPSPASTARDSETLAKIKQRSPAETAAIKAEVQQARLETAARDQALVTEVHGKTIVGHDGHQHVEQVFDHVTIGAGFAGVANELSRPDGGNGIVIGSKNPWDGATSKFGQKAGDSEVPNHLPGHGMTETASDPDAPFMIASEHADNVALCRNDAKLRTYDGKSSALEPGPQADWPEFARRGGATNRFKVTDADGTERYFYSKQTDLAGGPGPNRKLDEDVLDAATLKEMLESGAFAFGDQSFGAASLARTGEIANIGPGASGAWGTEAAASTLDHHGKRANQIEWIGVNPSLDHQHDLAARAKLAGIYDELAAAKAANDPARTQAAKAALTKFLFEEAARNGNLPRNRERGGAFDPAMQRENGGNISRRAVEGIEKVTFETPPGGGPKRVKITLKDVGSDGQPIVVWKDCLILSIGQDARGAGGPVELLKHYKEQLLPIYGPTDADGFRPVVGVTSKDGSIRVLGAASTPEDVSRLIDNTALTTKEHQANLRTQAEKLSANSKGVVQGFVLAQQHIETANKVLADTLVRSAVEQRIAMGLEPTS